MKRFWAIVAVLTAAMLSFASCDDNTIPIEPDTEEETALCDTCGQNPCVCEGEPVEAPESSPAIKIDGEFDDWAALDTSKVATAVCSQLPYKTALKTMKVYADSDYISIYFEVDEDEILGEAPLDIYINADNSENEAVELWSNQGGVDYLIEGFYYVGPTQGAEPEVCSFDAALYGYLGSEEIFDWLWDPETAPLVPKGIGLTSGAGTLSKYELTIVRELLKDVKLSSTFGLGLTVSQEWSPVGVLPNGEVTDDNPKGAVKFLEVKIN